MKKKKPGREFEEAVLAFANTLDPSAEVLFDLKVRDRDNAEPRQCDVWINAKFGGHWPLSILVSCKDHRRKLHSGDIGAFCDEKRSTGADMGVIYSRAGFTKPALIKAKANGIACCKIYENQPADMPLSIWLEQFTCKPNIQLSLTTDLRESPFRTWNDIFDLSDQAENQTVLDIINIAFRSGEQEALMQFNQSLAAGVIAFPSDWGSELRIHLVGCVEDLSLQVFGRWKRYRARSEAVLLKGSYCLSNDSFKGTITGPSIDTWGRHPGEEGWEEITDHNFALPLNRSLCILSGTDVRSVLQEALGDKLLYEN
jgi:hypothetical protein